MAIDVDEAAEDAWVAECQKAMFWPSPLSVCTPGYMTLEGKTDMGSSPEEQQRKARTCLYNKGLPLFREVLDEWRANGKMEGMVLSN